MDVARCKVDRGRRKARYSVSNNARIDAPVSSHVIEWHAGTSKTSESLESSSQQIRDDPFRDHMRHLKLCLYLRSSPATLTCFPKKVHHRKHRKKSWEANHSLELWKHLCTRSLLFFITCKER